MLPERVVQCVRGACCAMCVWRGHTPQSPEHYYTFFADRRKKKAHNKNQHAAAVVDKTNGAVIVVESAHCQPSGAYEYGHMTSPAFAAASR